MADFNLSASAKSSIPNSPAEIITSEAFQLALARGLDKVWRRKFDVLQQGMQFVREMPIARESASYRTYRGLSGLVGQNRDTDDIPYITSGDGFGYTVQTYNYRQGVAHEKTLAEVDDVGVISRRQNDLADNSLRTMEYTVADIFNRAVSPSNAPVLADDGMYLIDEDRPNADPNAGTWSNQESNSAITPSAIFQAQLNARATTDESGELNPQKIKAIVVRPQDAKTIWEIRNANYRPTDAMMVNNYFKENKDATFDVVVYDYLTSASIFYILNDPKSDKNELAIYWRVRPEFETFKDGSNPHIIRQTVRFAFGIGCGSPREFIRGGVVA